jgi:hypothetical protein
MAERLTNEETMIAASTFNSVPAPREARRRWIALAFAAGMAVLLLVVARVDSASAKSEIFGYSSTPSTTQAGAHPDIITTFELGSRLTQAPVPCYCNDPKSVTLHTPGGVVANPHVVSVCPVAELALFACPTDSQAGLVVLKLFSFGAFPIFRTQEQKGQAALFAFSLPFGISVPQYTVYNARTGGDYGLDIKTIGISHLLSLLYYAPVYWGVPAEPYNDFMRFDFKHEEEHGVECEGSPIEAMEEHNAARIKQICNFGAKEIASSLPVAPLTQNPTTCVGPLQSSIDDVSYDRETDHAEQAWPATTGCDALSFDPSLAANPTTTETDTASGLEVNLEVPQFQDPFTPSPSELRANTVTLPPGFSLNSSAADGKTSCSDIASRVGTELEAECPEFSKVGTTEIDSSALPAPIFGYVYLGEPKPGDPYRLVLTANGFGTAVKILGSVRADPQTGQLVTAFENLPQTPFQRFNLHFFGSERGMLATSTQCGTFPVHSTFTPWDTFISDQTATQFFTLDSGPVGSPCPNGPRPFHPGFEAGGEDNTAGTHSAFHLRLTRADGDQNLSGLDITTPPGFAATLRGVPYCPQTALNLLASPSHSGSAEQASPACPAGSQVGTAIAGAGAGTHQLYTSGKVYLTGPYKGAPLSLVTVIPARSGPYDFGNVVVRAAITVNPLNAQVTVVSDPLPKILEGVPLRLRSIRVALDRSGFALNPTNCSQYSVDATVHGDEGAAASPSVPFQVANCTDLGFSPQLSMKLTGGVKRLGHPAIHATLTAKPGEANIQKVSVALPKGEQLDNAHIGTICTKVKFAAGSCPAGSVLGNAQVTTPLLDQPLKGKVYLRSSSQGLPDLAIDLRGQFNIELVGTIDTVNGGALRTTFKTVPDAPVSKVVLNLTGGSKGLVVNSQSLCGRPKKATVGMTGQNGATLEDKTPLQTNCGSSARHKRNGRRFNSKAVR